MIDSKEVRLRMATGVQATSDLLASNVCTLKRGVLLRASAAPGQASNVSHETSLYMLTIGLKYRNRRR